MCLGRLRSALVAALGLAVGCASPAASPPSIRERTGAISDELVAMAGPDIAAHQGAWRAILEDNLAKDAYVCFPAPREVFFAEGRDGERLIRGVMPHYGFFLGPMQYTLRRSKGAWEVDVTIAVRPPPEDATLELPDCALRPYLTGELRCEGTPYAESGSTEACPGSGRFEAPASRQNVAALLARWSREAEGYYNRDARASGIPVRYDFEIVLEADAEARRQRVDLTEPLSPTCGRTPYFAAMRAGWSLPIVAHEIGHVMGLLDEYEAFSGIVSLYPKTPFVGAETSRMGLSMKEQTRVLPIHHYLILRRYFCPEPEALAPYGRALP